MQRKYFVNTAAWDSGSRISSYIFALFRAILMKEIELEHTKIEGTPNRHGGCTEAGSCLRALVFVRGESFITKARGVE